jgi:cytochrome P450
MEAVGAPADLVQSFALVIPSMVICELLGVPYQDRREFQERAVVRLDSAGTPSARSRAVEDSVNYMKALVRQQRKEPGRGLIGLLIREHGDEIDDHELAGIGDLLLLGGHETTANMLALGTVLLLQHPEHQALVRDESTAGELIEELLRYLSVVQTGVPRVARVDTALGGRQIRQGERVLCSLPSGNHDESLTPDGDTFNPRRGRTHHLAFGHGIHYCVGAPLARLEMLKAFPALLERFPALHVTVPLEKIPFRPASAIYGAVSIPVSW